VQRSALHFQKRLGFILYAILIDQKLKRIESDANAKKPIVQAEDDR